MLAVALRIPGRDFHRGFSFAWCSDAAGRHVAELSEARNCVDGVESECNMRSWSRRLSNDAAEAHGLQMVPECFCGTSQLPCSGWWKADAPISGQRWHLTDRASAHAEFISGPGMQSCAGIFIRSSKIARHAPVAGRIWRPIMQIGCLSSTCFRPASRPIHSSFRCLTVSCLCSPPDGTFGSDMR